ncbi:O-methyltransferase [Flexistipes sp.]|uniref:O-methyltransferase n=1 Tax=Flexistipes sp. TaxID=3088135 RepID=UPI002E1FC606|nr:methyltransferase domain-containing protein [Flexistipes sp.]
MQSELMYPFLENFLNSYESIDIEKIYSYSLNNKIPAVDKSVGEFLRFLVQLKKPKNLLELGCGAGVATKYLLFSDKIKLTAVDYNADRLGKAKEHFSPSDNVEFVFDKAENFLDKTEDYYDFVFVDTIKREYPGIWHMIRRKLKNNALVVFDDILLYGYTLFEDAEIPGRYIQSVKELRNFINEIKCRYPSNSSVIPIGNGLLLINHEKC